MAEHEFKGNPNKVAPQDYVSYHHFTHDHKGYENKVVTSDGDIAFTAEIICVHTFNNENLDVFHPLYEATPAPTITKAIVTHTECQSPTEHKILEGENFSDLVNKWIDSLEPSSRQAVRTIIYENYTFLQYLE